MSEFEKELSTARLLYDQHKYEEAGKAYLRILSLAENNQDKSIIWAELCWTFFKMNSFQQCLEAAQNVMELDAHYGAKEDLYRLMGYSYIATGDNKNAEKYLLESLKIENKSHKQQFIYYELAKIYFRREAYLKSLENIDKVETFFEMQSKDYWFSALFFKGFIRYYQKDLAESERIFNLIVNSSDQSGVQANGFYGLAYVAFENKKYLDAINLCEKVTKLNPGFYDMESLGFLMAASFFYLNRFDIFEMYYNEIRKKFPKGRYEKELSALKKQVPVKESQESGKKE